MPVPSASPAGILRERHREVPTTRVRPGCGDVRERARSTESSVRVRVNLVREGPAMRTRLTDLLGIELPIVQAPMAGANDAELAVAVCEAGGLGSLPCATIDLATARSQLEMIRTRTAHPI